MVILAFECRSCKRLAPPHGGEAMFIRMFGVCVSCDSARSAGEEFTFVEI